MARQRSKVDRMICYTGSTRARQWDWKEGAMHAGKVGFCTRYNDARYLLIFPTDNDCCRLQWRR
jgi:hypothetical protein